MINVAADMEPMLDAIGVIDGVANAVQTDIYVNYVTSHAADALKKKFESSFLATALSNPRAYHHVFEWGSLGYNGILQDSGVDTPVPLYALTKKGRGSQKEVGFRFKQSRIQVPLPDSARSGIPQENIDMLKKRAVFRFKAYVMESGMMVHVSPRPGTRRLFVPSPTAPKGFAFSQGYNVMPGKGNAGNFTSFWTGWWEQAAPKYMEDSVMPRIERDIAKAANENLRKIRRGKVIKTKTFRVANQSEMNAMSAEYAKMTENQIIRLAKQMSMEDTDEWDEGE